MYIRLPAAICLAVNPGYPGSAIGHTDNMNWQNTVIETSFVGVISAELPVDIVLSKAGQHFTEYYPRFAGKSAGVQSERS